MCLYGIFGYTTYLNASFLINFDVNIQTFLPYALYAMRYGSHFILLCQMIQNRSSWKSLFRCLSLIEIKVINSRSITRNSMKQLSWLCILTLFIIFVNFANVDVANFTENSQEIVNFIQTIAIFCKLLITVFALVEVSNNFLKQISYIENEIKYVFTNNYLLCRKIIMDKLEVTKYIYKHIYLLSKEFNAIFILPIVLYMFFTFLQLLVITNWIVLVFCTGSLEITTYLIFFIVPFDVLLCVSYFL